MCSSFHCARNLSSLEHIVPVWLENLKCEQHLAFPSSTDQSHSSEEWHFLLAWVLVRKTQFQLDIFECHGFCELSVDPSHAWWRMRLPGPCLVPRDPPSSTSWPTIMTNPHLLSSISQPVTAPPGSLSCAKRVKWIRLISQLLWAPGVTWRNERAGSHLCFLCACLTAFAWVPEVRVLVTLDFGCLPSVWLGYFYTESPNSKGHICRWGRPREIT